MNPPLDDRYLEWLYSHIGAVRNRNPAASYWLLAKKLYSREFVWLVANDNNRVDDGVALRDGFMEQQGSDEIDPNWMGLGCSMLEMLIALSQRAYFETDVEAGDWFWLFMEHMGLRSFSDAHFKSNGGEDVVDWAVDQVIFRTYSPDGSGGLFPLRHPSSDQRRVELWYQLSAYLLEGSHV